MSKNKITPPPVMECRNISASRDGHCLTAPHSFCVAKGDYLQLRGPNGCGKSTLLRHLAGFLPLVNGTILIEAMVCAPTDIPQQKQLCYLGHNDALAGDLSGYENFELLTGQSRVMLAQLPLYERPVASYSAGQRQKLNLQILDDAADIWLLDEPSSNLDDANSLYLEERIAGFLATGGIVIASTHSPLAQSLVTQIIHLAPLSSGEALS